MSLREELLRRFPRLRHVGATAVYAVGGAVRDLLLGREPHDVDIATIDARACADAIGRNVIRLGKEELIAYRIVRGDVVYDVTPLLGGSIDQDLARRDFTINAMAVRLDDGALLDPHGGQRDLAARLVRMIDAKNFDDDPLRMLKAVRMAIVLGFTIDEATRDAIRARAEAILTVAPERVTDELATIFASNRFRDALALLHDLVLDVPLLGRVPSRFHADDVPLAAAFALLLDDPRQFAERWRWSEQLLRDVLTLQRLRGAHDDPALYDAGKRVARQLGALQRAAGEEETPIREDLFAIRPLLTGDEIAALTALPPGPAIGRIKRALLEAQIAGRVGGREEAEAFVRMSPRA